MKVSSNFRLLNPAEVETRAAELKDAWTYHTMPRDQWAVARAELKRYQQGEAFAVFDALVNAVRETQLTNPNVLDVGAGVGAYRDVLRARAVACRYEAMDYSKDFSRFAQTLFPDMIYDVADATAIPFADESFDIVMSGACIMHVFDYAKVISECARIASKYVILHRTPVRLNDGPTQWFEKEAYGVRCVEAHYNEVELIATCVNSGLIVKKAETISVDFGMGYEMQTYLLVKA